MFTRNQVNCLRWLVRDYYEMARHVDPERRECLRGCSELADEVERVLDRMKDVPGRTMTEDEMEAMARSYGLESSDVPF